MKKYVMLILLLVLLVPTKSKAYYDVLDERCTNDLKLSLKKEANDITYRVSKNGSGDKVTYTVIFYNVSENLFLTNGDEEIELKIEDLKPGSSLVINVYAAKDSYCDTYKARTMMINVPYYNKYSEKEICNNYRNYSLCKENTNITLTEAEFDKEMNNYIESLKAKEKANQETIDDDTLDFTRFLEKYGIYVGIGVVLVAAGITAYVMWRKKKYGIL